MLPRSPNQPCSVCGALRWPTRNGPPNLICHPCRRRLHGLEPGLAVKSVRRVCASCGGPYSSSDPSQVTCSNACGSRYRTQRTVTETCVGCGSEFIAPATGRYVGRRFCSDRCRYRAKQQRRRKLGLLTNSSHQARARKHGVRYEPIDVTTVYTRDRWRCGICRRQVNPKLTYPHPMSASLDHLLPLALGGDHVYANVQAAHLQCNMDKGTAGTDQLALIG